MFPYDYHYIPMNGTIEDYVDRCAAHNPHERLVYFFLVYEGQVTPYGETCFRVVFDPQPELEFDRIQFVSTEEDLKRIALPGMVENRTSGELLDQAMEAGDGILR
ncbi:hypothetical protein BGZ76_009321 [Entomortierella beljakovae]|nr:hypothetical protein BGZ76_009321 [Entomortierella beljakovae]